MHHHRIFLAMATACIDGLSHDERVAIDPAAFSRLVQICASVASGDEMPEPATPQGLPVPPPMSFIKAYMLRPGDYVWGPAAAYTVVDTVLIEDVGPADSVYVTWRGGGTSIYGYAQPVRIALNRDCAGDWNVLRTEFTPDVVEALVAAYTGRLIP